MKGGVIMSRFDHNPCCGMLGFMQSPRQSSYTPPIFCVSNPSLEEICIFLTDPNCHDAVYSYGSIPKIKKVNIFTNKIDMTNISDIHNIINDLVIAGKDAKLYYPETIPDLKIALGARYIVTDLYCNYKENISVEYHVNESMDRCKPTDSDEGSYYDMQIELSTGVVYIPALLDITNLPHKASRFFDILLPYKKTRYGGLNYNQVYIHRFDLEYETLFDICACSGFRSPEEMQYAIRQPEFRIVQYFDTIHDQLRPKYGAIQSSKKPRR